MINSYLCQVTSTFPVAGLASIFICILQKLLLLNLYLYIVYMEPWCDRDDVNSTGSYQRSMIKIKVIRCWPAFHEGKHKMRVMYQYTFLYYITKASFRKILWWFLYHIFCFLFILKIFVTLHHIQSHHIFFFLSSHVSFFLFHVFFFFLPFHHIISSQHKHFQLQIINIANS